MIEDKIFFDIDKAVAHINRWKEASQKISTYSYSFFNFLKIFQAAEKIYIYQYFFNF